MRKIRNCLIEGRDDCQQLKPKGSHASFVTTMKAVTILLMLSILFGRVTVLFLYCPLCFFKQFFSVTWFMYDARRRDFASSAVGVF